MEKKHGEDRSDKLVGMLQAYLLINPQSESALLNLQKVVEELDEETSNKIYELVKKDLTARMKRQIARLKEQIERM